MQRVPAIHCTQFVFNQLSDSHPIEFRGCSDIGNTAGSGKTLELTFAKDGGNGTIAWNGTGTATIADEHFTYPKPDVCANKGFEAYATFKFTGGSGKAKVSIRAGWTLRVETCWNQQTGNVKLVKGTVLTIS